MPFSRRKLIAPAETTTTNTSIGMPDWSKAQNVASDVYKYGWYAPSDGWIFAFCDTVPAGYVAFTPAADTTINIHVLSHVKGPNGAYSWYNEAQFPVSKGDYLRETDKSYTQKTRTPTGDDKIYFMPFK